METVTQLKDCPSIYVSLEAVTPDIVTDVGSADDMDEAVCNVASPDACDNTNNSNSIKQCLFSEHPFKSSTRQSSTNKSDSEALSKSFTLPTNGEKSSDSHWNMVKVRVGFDITRKGERSLVIDGYKFTKSRDGMGDRVFWRCSRRECKATAVTVSNKVEHVRAVHSHLPPVAAEFFADDNTRYEQEVRFSSLASIQRSRVRRQSQPSASKMQKQSFEKHCYSENGHGNAIKDLPLTCSTNVATKERRVNGSSTDVTKSKSEIKYSHLEQGASEYLTLQTVSSLTDRNESAQVQKNNDTMNTKQNFLSKSTCDELYSHLTSTINYSTKDIIHNLNELEDRKISIGSSVFKPSVWKHSDQLMTSTQPITTSTYSYTSKNYPSLVTDSLTKSMENNSDYQNQDLNYFIHHDYHSDLDDHNCCKLSTNNLTMNLFPAVQSSTKPNLNILTSNSTNQMILLSGDQLSGLLKAVRHENVSDSVSIAAALSLLPKNLMTDTANTTTTATLTSGTANNIMEDHNKNANHSSLQSTVIGMQFNPIISSIASNHCKEKDIDSIHLVDSKPNSLSVINDNNNLVDNHINGQTLDAKLDQIPQQCNVLNHQFGSASLTLPLSCVNTKSVNSSIPTNGTDLGYSTRTSLSIGSKLSTTPNLLVHWKKEKMRESVEVVEINQNMESIENSPNSLTSDLHQFGQTDLKTSDDGMTNLNLNYLTNRRKRPSSNSNDDDSSIKSACSCVSGLNLVNQADEFRNTISNNFSQTVLCHSDNSSSLKSHSISSPLLNDENDRSFCSQIQDGILVKVLSTVQQLTARLDADADPPEVIQNCHAIQACLDTIAAIKRARSVRPEINSVSSTITNHDRQQEYNNHYHNQHHQLQTSQQQQLGQHHDISQTISPFPIKAAATVLQ